MKQLISKTKKLIAVAVFICMLSAVSYASDDIVPDSSKTGSISIDLVDHITGAIIPGGEIEVIKVADIDYSAVAYVYTDEFSGMTIPLGNFSDSSITEALVKYIDEASISGEKYKIDDKGHVKVDNLELGAYIVKQTVACEGYFPFNTFLITVPVLEGDTWIYDVNAEPKMDPTKAMTPTPTSTATPTPTAISVITDVPTPTPPEKLPQTGQLKWPIPVCICGGIVLILIGWTLLDGKNKKDDKDDIDE